MSFTHYDLGYLENGRTIEVLLEGNAANVRLLDHANFSKYVRLEEYTSIGELVKESPVRRQTTHRDHWHIVIDLPHGYGTVKTTYKVLKEALPVMTQKLVSVKPSALPSTRKVVSSKQPVQTDPAPSAPAPPAREGEIVCPSCGVKTPVGKFCLECGSPLVKKCAKCQTIIPPHGKFCLECGEKLA